MEAREAVQKVLSGALKNAVVVSYWPEGAPGLGRGAYTVHASKSARFVRMLEKLSGVIGRQGDARVTYCPDLAEEIAQKVSEQMPGWRVLQFGIEQGRLEIQKMAQDTRAPVPELVPLLGDGLQLYPFQNQGVRFIENSGGNCILGDEMGLGKTVQTLAYLRKHSLRAVVVSPKSAIRRWEDEACKFFPGTICVELSPRDAYESSPFLDGANLILLNYESLGKVFGLLREARVGAVVVDESHRLRNPRSASYKLVKKLLSFPWVNRRILLSGTAARKKSEELHPQLELVSPGLLTLDQLRKGCIGNARHLMRGVYLRREKEDVAVEFPPKTRTVVQAEARLGEKRTGKKQALKHALEKADSTASFVRALLSCPQGPESVLVFTEWVDCAKRIQQRLGEDAALLHLGSHPELSRERVRRRFQDRLSDHVALVSTRSSMAEGVELTRADAVVFNDVPSSMGEVEQAEDRVHRLGRRKLVLVYFLTSSDGRDLEQLVLKSRRAKTLLSGKTPRESDEDWVRVVYSQKECLGSLGIPQK